MNNYEHSNPNQNPNQKPPDHILFPYNKHLKAVFSHIIIGCGKNNPVHDDQFEVVFPTLFDCKEGCFSLKR